MLPYTLDEIVRRVKPVAVSFNLPAVYLFGSYARGDATADSDVDLLVDLSGTGITGLDFARLYAAFEDALGTTVDLVTVDSLDRPPRRRSDRYFQANVKKERKMIYAVA